MDETKLVDQTFDRMDVNCLEMVLYQVARRILEMRSDVPGSVFWSTTINRIGKWISSIPVLVDVEKDLVVSGNRMLAIKAFRARTGTRLMFARDVVDLWVLDNEELVNDEIYMKARESQKI